MIVITCISIVLEWTSVRNTRWSFVYQVAVVADSAATVLIHIHVRMCRQHGHCCTAQ